MRTRTSTPILLLATVALGLASGCGAIRPVVSYSAFGDADPEGDDAVVAGAENGEDVPKGDVRVLVDQIPEGLELSDGKITVLDGYDHQLVGKFKAVPQLTQHGFLALFSFADYEAGWRKGYCYPQTVLNYLTLTMWSYLVPLAYPCWGDARTDKASVVRYARRVAKAAGGNLVIMSYVEIRDFVAGLGYILVADPRMLSGELETKPGVLVDPKKDDDLEI